MTFAGTEIAPATIERTRRYFADLCGACVAEAESGKVRVNDLSSYVDWQKASAADYLAGKQDHTFTFVQRAHWLQTGESIPLLAPTKQEGTAMAVTAERYEYQTDLEDALHGYREYELVQAVDNCVTAIRARRAEQPGNNCPEHEDLRAAFNEALAPYNFRVSRIPARKGVGYDAA